LIVEQAFHFLFFFQARLPWFSIWPP